MGSFSRPFSIFAFYSLVLGEQIRTDDADKFAGVDDFGFLPELWGSYSRFADEGLLLGASFSGSLCLFARRFDGAVNLARRKGRGALAL